MVLWLRVTVPELAMPVLPPVMVSLFSVTVAPASMVSIEPGWSPPSKVAFAGALFHRGRGEGQVLADLGGAGAGALDVQRVTGRGRGHRVRQVGEEGPAVAVDHAAADGDRFVVAASPHRVVVGVAVVGGHPVEGAR